MKIGIDYHDNVYHTLEKLEGYESYIEVDLSEEEIDRILAVQEEWFEIQDKLDALYERGYEGKHRSRVPVEGCVGSFATKDTIGGLSG